MAAYLVADYDALARAALTAQHVGVIHRKRAEQTLRQAGRALRRVFGMAVTWREDLPVTRADLRQGTDQGIAARAAMGVALPYLGHFFCGHRGAGGDGGVAARGGGRDVAGRPCASGGDS